VNLPGGVAAKLSVLGSRMLTKVSNPLEIARHRPPAIESTRIIRQDAKNAAKTPSSPILCPLRDPQLAIRHCFGYAYR
jgi:hypothetical protein